MRINVGGSQDYANWMALFLGVSMVGLMQVDCFPKKAGDGIYISEATIWIRLNFY